MKAFAILQHAADRRRAGLLRAAQRLLLEGRDATSLIAGRRILAYGLAVAEVVLFEVVDETDGGLQNVIGDGTFHEQVLCSEHLRHLGQDGASTLRTEPVGEAAQQRVGGDAGEAVGATAFQSHA